MVFEEIMINQFLQSFSFPLLDLFFKGATYFGHPGPWFFLGAILFWIGREKQSFKLVSLILFASFFSGILKYIIARPRPVGIIQMEPEFTPSMPSGHSTIAGAISAYSFFSKEIQKNYAYVLLILALLAGLSRIYLGVHFLTDVLAGLLLGALIGWFVFKIEHKLNKMEFHITKLKEESLIIAFFVIVVICYLFIPAEFYGAFALLGYFAGYAIYRHTEMKEILLRPQTKRQSIVAVFFGLVFLGALGLIAYVSKGLIAQGMFFICGIFVTLLWPIVISKLVLKREKLKNISTKKSKYSSKKVPSKRLNSKKKKAF